MRLREARKRLWTLIRNICTGQDAQTRASLYKAPLPAVAHLYLLTCLMLKERGRRGRQEVVGEGGGGGSGGWQKKE